MPSLAIWAQDLFLSTQLCSGWHGAERAQGKISSLRVEQTSCLVILELGFLDHKAVRKESGDWGQSGSHSEKSLAR